MQITPINQDNRSFQALHATKRELRAMGTSRRKLLAIPAIREAAKTYEVLVKPSKKTRTVDCSERINKIDSYILCMTAFSVAAFCTGGWLSNTTVLGFGIAGFAVIPFVAYVLNKFFKPLDEEYRKYCGMIIQAGEKFENGKLSGSTTEAYEITSEEIKLPDLAENLRNKIVEYKTAKIDPDDLFTAEKYLKMLQDGEPDANTLHATITENSDTPLTQFFDVVPDEERVIYRQIIDILKNIKGLNYNQKDGANISCLEKILLKEDPEVLEMVKDFEFDYTPGLESAFSQIENPKFKKQVLKLNIKFNDILEAVKTKSEESLKMLEPQLDSPFCNRKKLAKDISKTLKAMKDPVYEYWFKITYLKYMNKGDSNLID